MKMRTLLLSLAAGMMLVSSAAVSSAADDAAKSAQKEQAAAPVEVASVNGQKITSDVLDKLMQQAPQGTAVEDNPVARRALLDKLIEVDLISQEATKEGLDKEPDFEFAMDMLKKQQLYVALLKKKIVDAVKVAPGETKDYYDKNKDQYGVGEEIKASHILVDTEEEAKKIKERLDKGEDFAAVAKEKSKCPSAPRGGDLGFFGKGRMVPEFEKAAFALKEGEISGPVKTKFGWHIIKMTGRKPASVKSYDEVKGEIEQTLLQQKQRKAYDDLIASLKSKADIKINETAFAPKKADKPAGK